MGRGRVRHPRRGGGGRPSGGSAIESARLLLRDRVQAMEPRVYIETSIISYLAAWPSRDLVTAAHQQITHSWWRERRAEFELVVSELVLGEAAAGDPDAAARRMSLLKDLPLLEINEAVGSLAEALVSEVPLARTARADAVHIAAATCHGAAYLLTWNCTHIANAELRPRIEEVCRQRGYAPPVLCTPDELMGESTDD